jgi:hypothetical protein
MFAVKHLISKHWLPRIHSSSYSSKQLLTCCANGTKPAFSFRLALETTPIRGSKHFPGMSALVAPMMCAVFHRLTHSKKRSAYGETFTHNSAEEFARGRFSPKNAEPRWNKGLRTPRLSDHWRSRCSLQSSYFETARSPPGRNAMRPELRLRNKLRRLKVPHLGTRVARAASS